MYLNIKLVLKYVFCQSGIILQDSCDLDNDSDFDKKKNL